MGRFPVSWGNRVLDISAGRATQGTGVGVFEGSTSFQVVPGQLFKYKSGLLVAGDTASWIVGLSLGSALRLGFEVNGLPFGDFAGLLGFVILTQFAVGITCLLYTSPSPRDRQKSRMPSSA